MKYMKVSNHKKMYKLLVIGKSENYFSKDQKPHINDHIFK